MGKGFVPPNSWFSHSLGMCPFHEAGQVKSYPRSSSLPRTGFASPLWHELGEQISSSWSPPGRRLKALAPSQGPCFSSCPPTPKTIGSFLLLLSLYRKQLWLPRRSFCCSAGLGSVHSPWCAVGVVPAPASRVVLQEALIYHLAGSNSPDRDMETHIIWFNEEIF